MKFPSIPSNPRGMLGKKWWQWESFGVGARVPTPSVGAWQTSGGGIKIWGFASWEWQSPRGAAKQDAGQDPGLSSEVQGREIAFLFVFLQIQQPPSRAFR